MNDISEMRREKRREERRRDKRRVSDELVNE